MNVPHEDLVTFQAALSNALGLAAACDLQTQFQTMNRNPRSSTLVKSLREARDLCESYIEKEDNEVS